MRFQREILQIHNTIRAAGYGSMANFTLPQGRDPITGIPVGNTASVDLFFTIVEYTKEEVYSPAIANGLVKILVTPLLPNGKTYSKFKTDMENKGTKVTLNGQTFTILHPKVTIPDGETPLLARLFLGG